MTAPIPQKSDRGLSSVLNRHARLLAVLFALVVTLLRILLSRPLSFCGTPDACYYLGLAQELASGHGFHARFLYDFQQAHLSVPNTGIEYWRPGISLLLSLLGPFGGPTLYSSIVLTVLVGLLLASCAWFIALRERQDRVVALASFALCLVSNPLWVGSTSPDSALYYGAAVAWFLALFTVKEQGWLADALALVCVGCAYLIRNDAALLLVPLLAVLLARMRFRRNNKASTPAGRGGTPVYAALILGGFLLALAPMHLLYKAVLGTAFPSGTSRAFFLNDLGDFVSYRAPVSLQTLLSHGWKHLVSFRLTTLATVVYRVTVLMIGYPALIFLPALLERSTPRNAGDRISKWGRAWRDALPEMTGPFSFGLVALFVYSMVLPAIGGFSALRTAVGLMPFAFVLVVLAIFRVARTPLIGSWISAALIAAYSLSGLMEMRRDIPATRLVADGYRAEAAQLATLDAEPARSVVLVNDPVQFSVTTGYATVALPNNGLDAIAAAAQDFHATHLVLDSNNLPASPAQLAARFHPVRSSQLAQEHSLILELPSADERH